MFAVLLDCRNSPFTRDWTRSFCGSLISSAVTMHGPSGALEFERLAAAKLVPGHALGGAPDLAIAGSNVIDDGVTEHVLERLLDRDVAPCLADHDAQFRLAIKFFGEPRIEHDRIVGADHTVGGLHEEFRLLAADRRVRFLGVVVVIVAAAAQNGGGSQRRDQPDALASNERRLERIPDDASRGADRLVPRFDEGERAVKDRAVAGHRERIDDMVAAQEPKPLLARSQETHEFHGPSL